MNAKKVLLVLRDGYDAKYLASRIVNENDAYVYSLIIETGEIARKNKLKKYFLGKSFLGLLRSLINLAALYVYHITMMLQIKRALGSQSYPAGHKFQIVSDVNTEAFLACVQKDSPDIIINYGTAIYKPNTLRNIGKPIFNIHASILPFYKNVHSDFWAYINRDYENIGVSIFVVSEGVDTGNIVIQSSAGVGGAQSLSEIKVGNLRLTTRLVSELLRNSSDLAFLCGTEQDQSVVSKYQTPGIKALTKLFIS